jgi:hypothetical protein
MRPRQGSGNLVITRYTGPLWACMDSNGGGECSHKPPALALRFMTYCRTREKTFALGKGFDPYRPGDPSAELPSFHASKGRASATKNLPETALPVSYPQAHHKLRAEAPCLQAGEQARYHNLVWCQARPKRCRAGPNCQPAYCAPFLLAYPQGLRRTRNLEAQAPALQGGEADSGHAAC